MKSSTKAAAQLGQLNKKKGNEMEKENQEIDATNYNMVSMNGSGAIMILNPPLAPMKKEQALVLAAWIVSLASVTGDEFYKYLDAVQES